MSFAETYTHTFSSGELSDGTVTLSNIEWTSTITGSTFFGWDSNSGKGIQIGKAKEPATAYTLSSSAFADKMITNITVNASMASSGAAKLQVSVGGVSYIAETTLTTSAKDYTGAGTSSGDVVISFTNTAAKAFYIKSISITYTEASAGQGMILVDQTDVDFGKVTKTKTITVTGQNLNSAINTELQDGSNFSVEGDLTAEGGVLTVNFTATEAGKYNDVLVLTSGDVTAEVTLSGEVLILEGQGTKEAPYTVADVIALGLADKTPAWVEGYIIGALNSDDNNALETTGTSVLSNIVLADAANETKNYIPVALPSNSDSRKALNLADNPNNLGAKVAVYGTLETYFSKPGVKSVSEYEWVVEEPKYDMEIVCSNLKTMSEGNMTYFMGSSSDGMSIDLVVFGFEGKGTYEVEGSIDAGGEYFTLAGEAEYLYSEELEADALVAVVTANGAMSLKITMYKKTLVPTETIVVENMTKTIQSYGWVKQLTLDGEHETYGQVTLIASGCDGTYGTYAVTAWLGEDIELEGEGEWKNEGELDVLEVIAETADGKVLKIVGQTEYVAPVEPVSMYADVEFTVDEEGILRVTGTTNDEVAVQLYVYGWNEVGYGTYGEGEVVGLIGDTEVANQQYTATIEQEGNVAYLYVILNDGEGNLYDLTAGGMALENPAAGAGSRTTVIVEEAEITTSAMFPTDLEIYGWSNDDRKVVIALWDGTTKQYGEYTTDFVVEVDDEQYDLLENTVATYSLEDGLAVLRAAVAAGKDTLDLIVSGAPWVDPATAEPTDTVTLAFTKGTINVSFDGTVTIKGGNFDLGVQISTMGGDIYEGITSEQFNSYSSYLMIDWMQVKIYRGELKVVDLTNDVKVAYIGVLGADYKWYNITLTTADEIPTALDNINATVAPAKRINNGQLIIINNGVEYNAQGAIVK